jgi:dTDP-D-glucose 4,6-dehydratase
VEKLALRIKKPTLRTKVVSAGLIYGDGESTLDFLFKVYLIILAFVLHKQRAWYGESLPIIGATKSDTEPVDNSDSEADPNEDILGGNNVVPNIHVKDLAQVIGQIILSKNTEDNYILAVDASNSTLSDIVKALIGYILI